MDIGDSSGDLSGGGFEEEKPKRPRELPDDLPKSLEDRRNVPAHYTAETEMYDAWQGKINRMLLLGRAGELMLFQDNRNS